MIRPLSQRPLAFIDTETTGLDPSVHEVIEVAVVKEHQDGRLEKFHSLIRPKNIGAAHPKALEVNGYNKAPERWEEAPYIEHVARDLAAILKGCVIVGHNVGFDVDFLQADFEKEGLKYRLPYHTVDTVTLAYEHLVPCGLESLSMDKIRRFLQWSTEGAHTAMKDAQDARRLYHLCSRSGKIARWVIRWGHQRRVKKASQEQELGGHSGR